MINPNTLNFLLKGSCPRLLVVFNKADLMKDPKELAKKKKQIKLKLANMEFSSLAFCQVSALTGEGINESLLPNLKDMTKLTNMSLTEGEDFVMNADHCFQVKGKGTVVTGTVLSGILKLNDTIDVPEINAKNQTVKGIQVFRKPVGQVSKGERCGLSIPSLNSEHFERGVICKSASAIFANSVVLPLNKISHYSQSISSNELFHVTVGHSTKTARVTIFSCKNNEFSLENSFDYEEKDEDDKTYYIYLDFESTPILCFTNQLFIGSKLDLDENLSKNASTCRLVFHGKPLAINKLPKIYKTKRKQGQVDRLHDAETLIVKNMFKKETNLNLFMNMKVSLSTGEKGKIASAFGTSGKVKVALEDDLEIETLCRLDVVGEKNDPVEVSLDFMYQVVPGDKNKRNILIQT